MPEDTFLLPEWAVRRTGTPAIILREEKTKDVFGDDIFISKGTEVMITSFSQGAVSTKTGRVYGDEVFCCLYILKSFNPRPFYIRAQHLHIPSVWSNRKEYTDINALDFFRQAMGDEEGRLISLPHEVTTPVEIL